MKLSDDKKHVALSIAGNLSAAELETLISDLSVIRSNMSPQVPFSQPGFESDGNISCQDDPRISLRLLSDGRFRFWLRNAGLGWMVFNLPVDVACTIRDYLIANTPKAANTSRNLFSKNLGDSDTTQ